MKIGRVFPDLLTPLALADSVAEALAQTLARLVRLAGADAGALAFRPARGAPVVVVEGGRRLPAELRQWLGAAAASRRRGVRLARVRPPGSARGRAAALLSAPLGVPGRPAGALLLLGRLGRLTPKALPAGFPKELRSEERRVGKECGSRWGARADTRVRVGA